MIFVYSSYIIIGLIFTISWIFEFYDNLDQVFDSIKSAKFVDFIMFFFVFVMSTLIWPRAIYIHIRKGF